MHLALGAQHAVVVIILYLAGLARAGGRTPNNTTPPLPSSRQTQQSVDLPTHLLLSLMNSVSPPISIDLTDRKRLRDLESSSFIKCTKPS